MVRPGLLLDAAGARDLQEAGPGGGCHEESHGREPGCTAMHSPQKRNQGSDAGRGAGHDEGAAGAGAAESHAQGSLLDAVVTAEGTAGVHSCTGSTILGRIFGLMVWS